MASDTAGGRHCGSAVLCVLLANSRSDVATLKSDNDVLRSDNTLQGTVIAAQAFNFNRFNQVAENASLKLLIDASSDKTVIEYREILRREKTCDLPVPADVAGGLLSYATVYVPAQCTPIPGTLTQQR
jgi:hypothetical protein